MRIALILCLATAALAQENMLARELQAGRQLLTAGEYDRALGHFARARTLAPRNWRGYTWECLGLILKAISEPNPHRRLQILQEAEAMTTELSKKCKVWFTDPLMLYLQAEIKGHRGQDKQAFTLLEKAKQVSPARYDPYAEIQLVERVKFAFGRACLSLAVRLVRNGGFEGADKLLALAEDGLKDTPLEAKRLRQLSVVAENMRRHDQAVECLRKVVELSTDPKAKEEMIATIAMIYFSQNRMEEGLKVLREAPTDSEHPDVIAAHCMHLYKQAIADPMSDTMTRALDHYRAVIKKRPLPVAYRLAEDFAEMVLAKVGPREAKAERALLEEAVRIVVREQERRPECAALYFSLYRLHRLLGNTKLEIHYQRLYEQKKKEEASQAKYDAEGRPFCR